MALNATALLTVALLTAIALSACINHPGPEKPPGYKYDKDRPAQRPATATTAHENYADCVLLDNGVTNHGYRNHHNMSTWYLKRCRLLEPPPLGHQTWPQVQDCIHNYGPWLASRYTISSFPKGGYASDAMAVLETICAPSPLQKP